MDRESMDRLRLDQRLRRRRGWVSDGDLETGLSELPDVSDKIAPAEEAPAESDAQEPNGA